VGQPEELADAQAPQPCAAVKDADLVEERDKGVGLDRGAVPDLAAQAGLQLAVELDAIIVLPELDLMADGDVGIDF